MSDDADIEFLSPARLEDLRTAAMVGGRMAGLEPHIVHVKPADLASMVDEIALSREFIAELAKRNELVDLRCGHCGEGFGENPKGTVTPELTAHLSICSASPLVNENATLKAQVALLQATIARDPSALALPKHLQPDLERMGKLIREQAAAIAELGRRRDHALESMRDMKSWIERHTGGKPLGLGPGPVATLSTHLEIEIENLKRPVV